LPTWKFDKNTGDYQDSSGGSGGPSWTDRVLWSHEGNNAGITNKFYQSLQKCKLGEFGNYPEHNPVVGSWTVEVKKINKEKRNSVLEQFDQEMCPVEGGGSFGS
jgi:hypothetical protein